MATNNQATNPQMSTQIKLEVSTSGSNGEYKLYISVGSPNNENFKPENVCKVLIADMDEAGATGSILLLNEYGFCYKHIPKFTESKKNILVRLLDKLGNKQVDKIITLKGPRKQKPTVDWGGGFLDNLFKNCE